MVKKMKIKKVHNCCDPGCGCHLDTSLQVKEESTTSKCGCGDKGCSSTKEIAKQTLHIDLLYLDLTVCSRCKTTESTLLQSLDELETILVSSGFDVLVNKIHIDSLTKAIKYRFESSPTIRLNGKDIISQTLESNCEDCGDLCGDTVDCRDWIYEGVRYKEPPKPLIIREILRKIDVPMAHPSQNKPYEVPENLLRYFASKANQTTK